MIPRILTPRRNRAADMRTLFMAGGVVASLLLLLVVLQFAVPEGRAIVEKLPRPDFASFLPDGSTLVEPVLEIEDLPQPSYVVPFMQGGAVNLALVEWKRDEGRYGSGGSVSLDVDLAMEITRMESLTLEPMGSGEQVIVARGTMDESHEGTAFLTRTAGGLELAEYEASFGPLQPGMFITDALSKVTVEDFDPASPGKEVSRVDLSEYAGSSAYSVWVWRDGALRYDRELSRVFEVSRGLFPEPPLAAE